MKVFSIFAAAAILSFNAAFAQTPAVSHAHVAPIPRGYLHTDRSQIVDSQGHPVRLDCVGWSGGNGARAIPDDFRQYRQLTRAAASGFNCLRLLTNDASFEEGAWGIAPLDAVVQDAGKVGLKVIIDHHNDEGGHNRRDTWGAQQVNGLWFDSGPGTDGTDGGGNKGTVTAARFQQDWVKLARHFAGNDTVIGFDLDNEPTIGGSKEHATVINWGGGGPTDIWAMCTNVGNAVEKADPGVLIICEGPQNYSGTFAGGGGTAPEGDLTMVATKPVVLQTPNHVVYSVHIYPREVSGVKVDSGPQVVKDMNHAWGYLVNRNIAPVWIGEMGASMNSADDTVWANMMIAYVNGKYAAQGGPVVLPGQEGVGTDWWSLLDCPGCEPSGWLKADNKTPKPAQAAVTIQFRPMLPPAKTRAVPQ